MLKKSLAILIFVLGLAVGFSASAASGTCPTDNGAGVGCNIGIGEYYCLGACRTGQSQCPSWTGTVCATGIICPANCASADSCGYCNSCAASYTLCGSYPSQTCTANTTAPAHCTSYNQCTATCSACANGYELLAGQCVGATLKLGPDSVGTGGYLFQSTTPSMYVLSSGVVGIGTSTPNASLEITPVSGYAILAGNYKIGNVALPTANADAATKGYVDSSLASATSSIATLWGGTVGGGIWNLNSGNVGIGTTNPTSKLNVVGSIYQDGGVFTKKLYTDTSNTELKIGTGYELFGTLHASGGYTTYIYPTGWVGGWDLRIGDSTTPHRFSSGGFSTSAITANSISLGGGVLSSYISSPATGLSFADSVGWDFVIRGATNEYFRIKQVSGNIGIGTGSPNAKLEIVPTSGYAVLAGNYKIGNVALPTVSTDAATKGYVDTTIASATSTLSSLWSGTLNGNIWNGAAGAGNVGIGTTTPTNTLDINGTARAISGLIVGSAGLHTGGFTGISSIRKDADLTVGATYRNSQLSVGSASDNGAVLIGYSSTGFGSIQAAVIGASFTNLALQATGGNVGIGTTGPGAKLAVVGTVRATGNGDSNFLADNGNGVDGQISLLLNRTGTAYNVNHYVYIPQSSTDLRFWVGNLDALTIKTSGNIGIGTTTPAARLEVTPTAGYAILAGSYKIGNVALPTANSDAATKGYVDSSLASATSSLSSLWSGTLNGNIWNGAAGAGNVGIGTTNPNALLDVAGNALVTGGSAWSLGAVAGIGTNAKGWMLAYDTTNDLAWLKSLHNNTAFKPLRIGASDISFWTAAGSLVQRMTIDVSGNVGIGTANPGAKLDVVSASPVTLKIDTPSPQVGETTNLILRNGAVGWDTTLSHYTEAGGINQAFHIKVGSTIRMSIGTNGLVGIGTTTPAATLEVVPTSGYAILAGNYKIGNVALPTANADAATKGYVDSTVASATSSLSSLWGGTLNGNIWNGTAGAGNVGIGTTNPRYRLEIKGADYVYALAVTNAAGTLTAGMRGDGYLSGVQIGTSDNTTIGLSSGVGASLRNSSYINWGSNAYWWETSDNLGIRRNATGTLEIFNGINTDGSAANRRDLLVRNIFSSGNVGIGTTTPSASLEIAPTTGYAILAGNYKIGNVALPTADADAATKGYVDTAIATATSSSGLPAGATGQTLRHNGTTWVGNSILFNDGTNIGIGTTTPATPLDVYGTGGYAAGIRITTNSTGGSGITVKNIDVGGHEYNFYSTGSGNSGGAGNFKIFDNTAFANRLTITGTGRIGLLTATPQSAVDVYGNLSVGSYGGVNAAPANGMIVSGNVGIGTTTPVARLEVVPTTGYAILAGNYRIGNVALPTADADAATKGYVDTAIATATSSSGLPAGATGQTLRHNGTTWVANSVLFNNGTNIGIGTTTPAYGLDVETGSIKINNNITGAGSSGTIYLGDGSFTKNFGSAWSFAGGLTTSNAFSQTTSGSTNSFAGVTNFTHTPISLTTSGNVGIGTTTPAAWLSIAPTTGYAILAGNYKIGNVALPTADTDVVTLGFLNSALTSVSAVAKYATSTPATYTGSQSGYSGANAFCAAVQSGTHVCTTGEILNTINTGSGANIPTGSTLWISNGPPGYTANANDCIGWTSATATDYGAVWVKLATGDGFGSLNACSTARSFACCK